MIGIEEKKGVQKDVTIDREENLRGHRFYWIGRRAQDIFFSALALIALSPVMLITALAIVIDDPGGSPIFVQDRVGRNGKLFKFYKFRSMCVDAEAKLEALLAQNEMDGPVFKIKDDPRITRVGKFIRKTSIDELPQLWNILKGDMSIIGPRPALAREVEQYGDYERQRLFVQPGLSCYWQIAPHRNELSFEEWVELDVKYINERSFITDWKIIFLTLQAVLFGYGE
ncbi:TPA: sugar transferase [Enterococcus faecium]|nr:sugar transferase [Enterococcus faecium]